jgi:hypothetical protein
VKGSGQCDDIEPAAEIASSVAVANLPWAFSQSHPLTTKDVIDEAKKRSFELDLSALRELYRHQLIVPCVYVGPHQVADLPDSIADEPPSHGTTLTELRIGRSRGRLIDLAAHPFKPRLRFEKPGAGRWWWNGLIYSRYQLLALHEARSVLNKRKLFRRSGRRITKLPVPDAFTLQRAARLRRIAIAATALEARYLPKLDPEWLRLVNSDAEDWQEYRARFDPVDMSRRLNYSPAQARADAEWLLDRAGDLDQYGPSWSQLVRRSPPKAWTEFKDGALIALDHRLAAELLLLFYEDMAERGEAEPLPTERGMYTHPLHERLSYRHETLDENLMTLGISPHPRVVLAAEGDTEEVHLPLVWQALGYPDAPELMRPLKLGTVDRNLQKVAALAAAPLVRQTPGMDTWDYIKPPTCLLVAVDPEGRQFGTPEKVARTRAKIIDEINAVLRVQGVTSANPSEIDQLVRIHTWSARCYEFAHFTDQELADGIRAVHDTINGLTPEALVTATAATRQRGKDIKELWSRWDYKPSKVALARALWPVLEQKIKRRMSDPDAPTPEIAAVVNEAYLTAQQWRHLSFVLSSAPDES